MSPSLSVDINFTFDTFHSGDGDDDNDNGGDAQNSANAPHATLEFAVGWSNGTRGGRGRARAACYALCAW